MLSNILKDYADAPKTIGYKFRKKLATLSDEEEACKDPYWAYYFALYISGADKNKCQEVACKDSWYAYCFAKNIPGADIGRCQEAACKNPYSAYCFAKEVPEADIGKCRKICKGTKYAF